MTEIGTWTARRRSRLRLPLLPQTARVELQFGIGLRTVKAISGDGEGWRYRLRAAAQNGRTRDHRSSAACSSYSAGRDASVGGSQDKRKRGHGPILAAPNERRRRS
jgi:hypothetical protein